MTSLGSNILDRMIRNAMCYLIFLSVLFMNVANAADVSEKMDRIKVLIIDGFSNHDWQRTSQLICAVLEPTKLFDISVTTAPNRTNDPAYATWNPHFSEQQVVIQNCNSLGGKPLWPLQVRTNFEKFVREGGGVFIFHSANNSFPEWEEYNRIIGLGWRKKEYGYAISINEPGEIVRTPPGQGSGTSHGARTDRVIHRIGDHAIHFGLPRTWKTPLIEVYTHARGPAEHLSVLSWAEDPEKKTRWPIEWTVEYGQGRIYNSTFGHVWINESDPINMRCAGFQTLLIRSLQWLAHRPVTYPVPIDFPDENQIVLRTLPGVPVTSK